MAGLYIHIPYCHSKCAYCDFYSTPRSDTMHAYIKALEKEYSHRLHEISQPFTTRYIGGGTPSALPPELLAQVLNIGTEHKYIETTIEVNPEDVNAELLTLLKENEINRVSMGVQSLIDHELKSVGRRHNAAEAITAARTIRDAGITNLSLDLIFGLPGQTIDSWVTTLKEILNLRPEHISAYSLMYEPGTKLTAMLNAGKLQSVDEEVASQMYSIMCSMLFDSGYEQYEISNFCLPGFHSRHNSAYWDFTPYLGIGASAHSYDGAIRRANPASVKQYLANPAAAFSEEVLTITERIEEYIMLRLRTSRGLDLSEFSRLFGATASNRLMRKATPLLHQGVLTESADRLLIPQSHFLTADSTIVRLI